MDTPQQPELERSGRGDVDPQAAVTRLEADRHPGGGGKGRGGNPVPPDNQPGHHPEHEQDEPEGPPRRS